MNQNKRAAFVSIVFNVTLFCLKLLAGFISGSISIISEAIHSASDMLASLLAFFSVSRSSEPADKEHPFGHGKYEDFSGLVEGALIIFAGGYIVYEAVLKLLHYDAVETINTGLGIWVMCFAVAADIVLSSYLFKIAKKTDSMAIYADAEHIRTDIFSTVSVLLGLIFIQITSKVFIDAVIAFVVAVIIANAGYAICKKALNNLLDGSLPKEDLDVINSVLTEHTGKDIVRCLSMQTRKSGHIRTVNLTLSIYDNVTIRDGHNVCDIIETEIKSKLENAEVIIHLEPENVPDKI